MLETDFRAKPLIYTVYHFITAKTVQRFKHIGSWIALKTPNHALFLTRLCLTNKWKQKHVKRFDTGISDVPKIS